MKKKRIVVLDDQDITLLAIKQHIEGPNREIVPCKTYEESLYALQQKPSDFFIADLKLKTRTLLEELKRIKTDYTKTQIIVITGMDISSQEVKENGADYFLQKPIDWQALELILSPPEIVDEAIKQLEKQLDFEKKDYLFQILEEMDFGVSILDPNRLVLYANKKQIKISGPIKKYRPCFESFAPHATIFCDNCPLDLSKVTTHVRRTGYYDIQCIPLKSAEGKTTGYVKISTEVTSRERLIDLKKQRQGTMPLKERMEGVLSAIRTMGFNRARMYITSEDSKYLIGYAVQGQRDTGFLGKSEKLEDDWYKQKTLQAGIPQIHKVGAHDNPWLKYYINLPPLKEWGEVPILMDRKILGIISVDAYNEDYPDLDFERLQPIKMNALIEVSKLVENLVGEALSSDLDLRKYEVNKIISDLDNEQSALLPIEEILNVMIKGVIKAIKYYWNHSFSDDDRDFKVTGHFIRKTGKQFEKVAGDGIIYEKGYKVLEWKQHEDYPCGKVTNTGEKMIFNDIVQNNVPHCLFCRQEKNNNLDPEVIEYMRTIKSYCCFPVKLMSEVLGLLSIQSPKPFLFNDFIVDILNQFVIKLSSLLSHFYLIDKEQEIRTSLMSNLIHTVRSPMGQVAMNIAGIEREIKKITGVDKLILDRIQTHVDIIKKALMMVTITSKTLRTIAQKSTSITIPSPPEKISLYELLSARINEIEVFLYNGITIKNQLSTYQDIQISLNRVNHTRFLIVLDNILLNSIKYSKPNGVIYVRFNKSCDHMGLIIQDEGLGIAEEDIPHIFDPGFSRRAEGHPDGTGMGLTSVKEILADFGWRYEVKSKLNEGTLFEIKIPFGEVR